MLYPDKLFVEKIVNQTRSSERKFREGNYKGAIEDKREVNLILNSEFCDEDIIKAFKQELSDLYSSKSIYPSENIEYSIQSLRGYEMLGVSFIPFEYNLETKELKVYKSVSINIVETNEYRQSDTISKGSTIFENMYKNMVINDYSFTDSRTIQNPSILYICGGDVATSNYNTFFRPLVEWRRQQQMYLLV